VRPELNAIADLACMENTDAGRRLLSQCARPRQPRAPYCEAVQVSAAGAIAELFACIFVSTPVSDFAVGWPHAVTASRSVEDARIRASQNGLDVASTL
jgi:hypothetical protein